VRPLDDHPHHRPSGHEEERVKENQNPHHHKFVVVNRGTEISGPCCACGSPVTENDCGYRNHPDVLARDVIASFDTEAEAVAFLKAPAPSVQEGVRGALEGLLKHYVALVESGDAGNWDAETEPQVIAARRALSTLPPASTEGGASEYDKAANALAVLIGFAIPEARYLAQDMTGCFHYSTMEPKVDPDGVLNMGDGWRFTEYQFPLCPEGYGLPSLRRISSGKVVEGGA